MKALLSVGPARGLERWLWPGLLSVLVHGALVAAVIGASGLVTPPRPDVVVAVALVFEVGQVLRPETWAPAPKQEVEAAPTPASVAAASVDRAGNVPPASDAPAAPRADAPPRYPYMARRRGLQGRVVLRVRVDPAGKPESVAVVRNSGHAVLDRSARNAVRRWRFTPAKLAGIPVAASVDVPVTFRLTD